MERKALSMLVVDHIDAMLAYWDKDLICRFANKAYVQWFGRTPEEMIDRMGMRELLGPLFDLNLPYIQGALRGERQTFERTIPTPSGVVRYSLANYYPDLQDGEVKGFFVHVADITVLKALEKEKAAATAALTAARQQIRTLRGLLPICAWCKMVRNDAGYWEQIETYLAQHSDLSITHGICGECLKRVGSPELPAAG